MLTDNTQALKDSLFRELKGAVNRLDEQMPSDVQDQIRGQNYKIHNHIRSGRPADKSIYDLGKLYRSIQGVNNIMRGDTAAPGGVFEAIVGTDVEYASYVHEGTSRIEPRPFLEDALNDHKEEYNQIIENAVKAALQPFRA